MFYRIALIGLCAIGLGGIAMWLGGSYLFNPFRHSPTQSASDSTPQTNPAKAFPATPKSGGARNSKAKAVVAAAASVAVDAAPPPVAVETATAPAARSAPAAAPPVEPPPFPLVQQISRGEGEKVVGEKYGGPAISTLTSTDGHIERTYVYTRDRGSSTTVIQLEDGRVASVYSKSIPPPPTGISIPRP